ncbi:DUF4307 domain-containing protein [Glutamicibacter creatinolyticus]|uniref:DUF4307 domain-containing protein n=1 Tax=Glutamicibacter creatinolyticus TaxID=162496 RepID=UPI0037C0DC64
MSDPSLMGRYHTPKKRLSPKTRNWLITGALGVGVVGAAYAGINNFTPISSQDVGFEIISPTQAVATVEVSYDSKNRVQCEVRAMNDSYAVVGFKTVVLEAEENPRHVQLKLDVPLRTDNLATTAGIEDCYKVPKDF